MPKQISLFRDLQTVRGTAYDELEPKIDMHLPQGVRACVNHLFLLDSRTFGAGLARSEIPCPYHVSGTGYTAAVKQTCECPNAIDLVRRLVPRFPRCSENRCPPRIIRDLPDE